MPGAARAGQSKLGAADRSAPTNHGEHEWLDESCDANAASSSACAPAATADDDCASSTGRTSGHDNASDHADWSGNAGDGATRTAGWPVICRRATSGGASAANGAGDGGVKRPMG